MDKPRIAVWELVVFAVSMMLVGTGALAFIILVPLGFGKVAIPAVAALLVGLVGLWLIIARAERRHG